MRRGNVLGVLMVAAVAVGAPTASASKPQTLSNERTLTTTAPFKRASAIRSAPGKSARRIAALRSKTADALPEVYIALKSVVTDGQEWIQIRVPGRPNGRKGWVPRSALGDFDTVTTQIVISRAKTTLTLYDAGKKIFVAPVGVGTAQNPTPSGHFWIDEAFKVDKTPAYGPFALGTSAFSPTLTDWPGGGVVGIHGTDQPGLIPGHISHGCVRLRNSDIAQLVDLVPVGTPVLIK